MTKQCTGCGYPTSRGWTAGGGSDDARRCLVCITSRLFASTPLPPRKRSERHPYPPKSCACGCGRVGPIAGWGLVFRCYRVLNRAGKLAQWKEARHG